MGAKEDAAAEAELEALFGLLDKSNAAAAEVDEPEYVGVPRGYKAKVEQRGKRYAFGVRGPSYTTTREPIYTMEHVVGISTWSPERINDLQQKLVDAGLITRRQKFRRGFADETTLNAFHTLLEYANRRGATWETTLTFVKGLPKPEDDDPEREPLTVRLPNRAELRETFEVAGTAIIGRRLDPATADRLAAMYESELAGAQSQAYAAAPGGGTVRDARSVDAFARQEITEMYPQEAGREDQVSTMNEFMDLLKSTGVG